MIRPQLRPDDDEFKKIVARAQSNYDVDSGGNNASSVGKGGGKSVDIGTASGRKAVSESQKDGKMGYGYYDSTTGDYVPWYIDMINGGGANQAGDEFVSPFPKGTLPALMTSLANDVPMVTPYGSQQERQYAPAAMSVPSVTGGGGNGGGSSTQSVPPVNPAPSYATMSMGEAGRGIQNFGRRSPTNYQYPNTPAYTSTNPYAVGGGFDVTAPPAKVATSSVPTTTPPVVAVGKTGTEQKELGVVNNTAIADPNTPVPNKNKTIEMMRKVLTDRGIQNNYLSDDMVRDLYKLVKKKK